MKKALRIGLVAMAVAAVGSATAVFNTAYTSEDYLSAPYVQTAVLRQGATGGEVKELQRRLKNWGYYSGAVDGIYGKGTVEAVKKFQKKNGLTADGVAGIATYRALGMNDSVKALQNQGGSSSSNYTNSDLYMLAKCIYAEARGESYTGQVAVGAVILNRVRSSVYPNSIAEVIYQSGQFGPAMSGWLDSVLASGGYTATAMQAAADALAGSNPIGDCLYFGCGNYGIQIGDHFFH